MLCGVDQLASGHLSNLRRRIRGARVAVLTHAAAVDRRGRSTVSVLEELGVDPAVVFTPEHGFEPEAQAEESVPSPDDEEGRTFVSLYGEDKASLSPTAEHLDGIEVLVIDLADVGSRYYTYVWSALLAARAAEAAGVHSVVLDRPNPISGDASAVEGAPQKEGLCSFVGLEPLPIRHSLTLAEILVHFFARDGKALGRDGALSVLPTRGWERHQTAGAWGRPFVLPSPNMPTVETALVYPGGCLVEGTNLSEGRGTTVPFQVVGAPFLDGEALTRGLQEAGLMGCQLRPVRFRPAFEKFAGQSCSGVMVHVTDWRSFRPVTTYLALLTLARAQDPEKFRFRTEPYEFEAEIPAFDLLTGSAEAREAMENGASVEEVVALVAPVSDEWRSLVGEAEQRIDDALV